MRFNSTHTHVCWLQTLDKVMTQRKSQYHEFRRMIALRAKQYFILMLSHRQYHGSMTFNHQTETLKLTVSLPLAVDVLGLCQVQARSCDISRYTSMTLHGCRTNNQIPATFQALLGLLFRMLPT